jgi:hypothetical protein
MWNWRVAVRLALGTIVLLHALAHAVLPLRGLLEFPPTTLWSGIGVAAYLVAMISLFAAGIGLLWSRSLAAHLERLMGAGLVGSVVALIASWDPSAWWGLAFDAALIGAFLAALNTGIIATRGTPSRSPRRRVGRWAAEALAWGLVAYVGVGAVSWPWHRHWGSTASEQVRALPGDPATRNPRYELMHAVTIDAPPEIVWAWLVQLGQDRAGFYSYDWLERMFFADVHNVYEIRPEWQQRAAGDFIRATQPGYLGGVLGQDVGWRVTHVDPGRAMVLRFWGAFVIEPAEQGRTRFMIRSPIGGPETPAWGAGVTFALFELPHFIMERKMMLTIKDRAERQAAIRPERSLP